MIEVKQAVKLAFDSFNELYDSKRFEDVLLEEVELDEKLSAWLVTIGFYRKMPSANIMESIGSKKFYRAYKQFHIDCNTGKLISMKNHRTTTILTEQNGV